MGYFASPFALSSVNLGGGLIDLLCVSLPFLSLGIFIVLKRRSPAVRVAGRKLESVAVGRGCGLFLILNGAYAITLAAGRLSLGSRGSVVLLVLKVIIAIGVFADLLLGWRAKDVQQPSTATDAADPDGAEPQQRG